MTPLATRVATAVVLVPCVLAALFLLPPAGWAAATLAVVLIAAQEWARLASFAGLRALAFVGGLAAIGVLLIVASSPSLAGGWPHAVLYGACGAATLFWVAVATPWVIRRWPVRSPRISGPIRRISPTSGSSISRSASPAVAPRR